MIPNRVPVPEHVRPLLVALADPASCGSFGEADWDRVIRLARNARLLGVLAHRIAETLDEPDLPERVRRHLLAGRLEARFRRQKSLHLLHVVAPLLQGHPGPWVLLKGAAYIAQGVALANGRLPSDVDLMVPRRALDGVERALLNAGWEFEKTDPYDQHYYRAWSHELAPMRAAGQALELDLHHTILPPIGRIRPDTERLFADAVPLRGSPFHVLAPSDQILHAAAHLAYDSDFVDRLRDLVDIDALLRAAPLTDPSSAAALLARARHHGMQRPLWLAATLCARWFGTPGSAALAESVNEGAPAGLLSHWVVHAACQVLGPADPDRGEVVRSRVLGRLLEARALWLRMPPSLLAYHAAAKAARSVLRSRRPHDQGRQAQA